jgi:site-specific recombinase XerD
LEGAVGVKWGLVKPPSLGYIAYDNRSNLKLSAVRKLAVKAADNGVLDQGLANGIGKVRGVKTAGTRAGNWLTQEQAQRLLNAPDVATVKGLRDRTVLAVMVGSGLRRSEVAALTVAHVQQREGRRVIVDLVGKGLRVRSVPMPSWAKAALDAWTQAAGITDGLSFRATRKGGHLDGESMTPQAIADVVRSYSAKIGTPIAAHDLRRTFAKLAHKGSGTSSTGYNYRLGTPVSRPRSGISR